MAKRRVLSNEEVEFLAESYLKLKQDHTYQNLSKTFHEYIEEFLNEELLSIKKVRISK